MSCYTAMIWNVKYSQDQFFIHFFRMAGPWPGGGRAVAGRWPGRWPGRGRAGRWPETKKVYCAEAGTSRETVYKALFYLLYPPAVFKHVHMQGFFVVAHLIVNSRGCGKRLLQGTFLSIVSPFFNHVCPVYATWGSFIVANCILIQSNKLQILYKSLTKQWWFWTLLCQKQSPLRETVYSIQRTFPSIVITSLLFTSMSIRQVSLLLRFSL